MQGDGLMKGMGFGRFILVLPLIFTVVFADKSCDIPLGDLGDYVIQYNLTLTNDGSEDAVLAIYGQDVKARAIVHPGGSVTATSYQGGFFSVEAAPAIDAVAELNQVKADAEAALNGDAPLTVDEANALDEEIQTINTQLKTLKENPQNGVCWSTLKPDEHGKGGEYDYQATNDSSGKWSVTGYCAN